MGATKDGRPHRWVNSPHTGITAFVTFTCLDFVRAFDRDEMRELACLSLLRDAQRYGTSVHAFVVMTHHVHLLVTCPEGKTISWLAQRFKSNLAKLALPLLLPSEVPAFGAQLGLNGRTFWKASFRALEISTEKALMQKALYIHLNPVRAELVEAPEQYRWSSRRFWDAGVWSNFGLDLGRVLDGFDQSVTTDLSP